MKVGTYVELAICDYNAFDESPPLPGDCCPVRREPKMCRSPMFWLLCRGLSLSNGEAQSFVNGPGRLE